ncbi:hypothetical protein K505DRAFT_404114 [Melanomma pulvis-pyrius CBS 109.77]|uniref:Uncharacterized protein n=1 Tax=Melanomma pulvis-pyrius CBS 109.77 TaxID=1314802 RepID=A0A6A6XUN1_9PLEO|nr:hypothetical protein K505DRAFT_404114 [Melanomma pulvis-pyrius CBS 109.77]
MAIFNLAPLPAPGLMLFQGYTAQRPESFIMKQKDVIAFKEKYTISFVSPTGGPGAPFLEIKEKKKKRITFKTMAGKEVMTIVKQTHEWSGRGTEYHGMRPDGTKMWHLKLHRGLTKTKYKLTIMLTSKTSQTLVVRNKVLGQDKGILLNGAPAATMSQPEVWSHVRREDFIHIAPGMDILLALGVNWVRVDKQNTDAHAAASAASDAVVK